MDSIQLPRKRRGRPTVSPEIRFWRFIEKTDGCWLWTGNHDTAGYGRFWFDANTRVPAHRVSYEFHYGPIPEGLFVCHHCDNPPCVNPAHLFLGTAQDNVSDMCAKGRNVPLAGSSSGRAKLTEQDVIEIRALFADGVSAQNIADKFHISADYVPRLARAGWQHIK